MRAPEAMNVLEMVGQDDREEAVTDLDLQIGVVLCGENPVGQDEGRIYVLQDPSNFGYMRP
jgi:hypothetical protein